MEAMKPVKVYSSAKRVEADMLVEVLRNSGISAYRQGVGSGGYLDICSGYSVFGENIFVDERDEQTAKELIEEIVEEGEVAESGFEAEPAGAEASGKTGKPVRLFALLAAILLILSLIFSGVTGL